jgi:hypothetical protein
MCAPEAPAAPDYSKLAEQQSAASKINQQTPWGTSSWTSTTNPDGTKNWSNAVELSQPQQAQFDANNRLTSGLLGTASSLLPQVQADMGNSTYADSTRENVLSAMMSRLQPQFNRDQADLDSRLANSGIEKGSDAWARSQDVLQRSKNDALAQAQLGASQQRGMDLNQDIVQQNQSLNQLNALRSGSQVGAPQFQGTQGQGTSYLDAGIAQGNAATAAYNGQVAGNNALMGGLASLGSAAILSDARLKKNIRRIGTYSKGFGKYTWDWVDDSGSGVGVLAQEVQASMPEAIHTSPGGWLRVDYSMIGD